MTKYLISLALLLTACNAQQEQKLEKLAEDVSQDVVDDVIKDAEKDLVEKKDGR